MIMSSAKTKGEMYLYTGSKVVGAAAPGVGIAVATGGAGAVGLLAGAVGTGALYGVSTGGNSKAQAEREGYTESQAVAYGTAVGIEEAVKSSAMSVVGGSGRFVSGIPTPVGTLGAGVTGFTMEYVDEAYINPAIRANILNDEAAYNIDYKQALINAGIAGVLVGGTYFIESAAASKNATEVVSNENVEVTYVENSEVVIEDVAGERGDITRPTWRQSEIDARADFPEYTEQISFLEGKEVPYGTKGSVRPDYYKSGSSVDIKNYNVETAQGRRNLANNISKQYYQRISNLPSGTKQYVLIDVRGQSVSNFELESLYNSIMEKTNNEITIYFKMS
jgi:hypothetical protein